MESAVDAPGRIAFVSAAGNGGAIVVMNADGTGRRVLARPSTPFPGPNHVAWSQDGTRIAYSGNFPREHDVTYDDDLYVIGVDSGRVRPLTRSPEEDWHPTWSPDGRKIAFDRQNDGANSVYVADVDGAGARRLTRGYALSPVWTPNGRISYIASSGVWVMNADGSRKRLLARATIDVNGVTPNTVSWSPDGTRVAYSTGSALWVMRGDGTDRKLLYREPGRTTGNPTWSPDGRQIAFTQSDGDPEIFVVTPDGATVQNLTDNEGVQDKAPSWSPDSRALAFVRIHRGKADIYVMTAAGEGERNLSSSPGDDWSPVWAAPG